jgi:hypothetical protein
VPFCRGRRVGRQLDGGGSGVPLMAVGYRKWGRWSGGGEGGQ